MNYFIDECGHSGDLARNSATPDFGDQPVFTLAAVGIADEGALQKQIEALKAKHNVRLSELNSPNWLIDLASRSMWSVWSALARSHGLSKSWTKSSRLQYTLQAFNCCLRSAVLSRISDRTSLRMSSQITSSNGLPTKCSRPSSMRVIHHPILLCATSLAC